MNDVFLQVCFQSLQQFHSDKNQQEVSKNFEQALNANEKTVAAPRFLERSKRPNGAWKATPRRLSIPASTKTVNFSIFASRVSKVISGADAVRPGA
jgi:hypothetical protein